jgi:hypothetical protein
LWQGSFAHGLVLCPNGLLDNVGHGGAIASIMNGFRHVDAEKAVEVAASAPPGHGIAAIRPLLAKACRSETLVVPGRGRRTRRRQTRSYAPCGGIGGQWRGRRGSVAV